MRLITIRISHFNERARWALDRFQVPYYEEPYMPLFHVPAVARATSWRGGRADRHSSRYSTPVLITDSGLALCDSSDIVRWASDTYGAAETTLYPSEGCPEIEAFELRAVDRLGGHVRRVAYAIAFARPGLLASLAERNVSALQARAFRATAPLIVAAIRGRLRVDERQAASLASVRAYLDEVAGLLGSRSYLIGDRFSAADLTLSALLAPLVLPTREEGYGASLPRIDELSERGASLVRETRAHPVGRYCLRMFAEERGRRKIPCLP
jgi:glutathione S-transferase